MISTERRLTLIGLLAVLVSVPAGRQTAHAAGEQFGGYQASASGRAVSFVPTVPGFTVVPEPFEGNAALTFASLTSGGTAFGRASTFWPGDLAANLPPLLAQGGAPPELTGNLPPYPFVAEAREYDGEVVNDGQPGATMRATGASDFSSAAASNAATDGGAAFTIGSSSSTSTSTLGTDEIVSQAEAIVSGVSIGGGVVTIDSVRTLSMASTDAEGGVTDGIVEVSGLAVGGIPLTIDSNGLRLADSFTPAVVSGLRVDSLLDQAGVSMAVAPSDEVVGEGEASRVTPGLIITLSGPPVATAGASKYTIVLGSTSATVAATPAFEFNLPLPPGSVPSIPSVPSTPGGPIGSPAGSLPAAPSVPVAPTSPSAPAATPSVEAEPLAYSFAGVPFNVIAGLFLLGIPGVRRVRRYLEGLMAMGATP